MVLVVMGVSGSGKTTVASQLSARLGWTFLEGDALHPQVNIEKMKAGHALTDEDRAPWIGAIATWVDAHLDAGQNGIITSSALKRSYRDVINRRGDGVAFIHLAGARETIAARLAARRGHFMPPTLLDSQFRDLEPPAPDEPSLSFDVGSPPEVIAGEIIDQLGLGGASVPTRS